MKKIFKTLLLGLLIITLTFSSTLFVSAETVVAEDWSEILIGDSDMNGQISIIDATAIQYYLAQLSSGNSGKYVGETINSPYIDSYIIGDVTGDNNVSILDATAIQCYLARIQRNSYVGKVIKNIDKQQYYENYFTSDNFKLDDLPEKNEVWQCHIMNNNIGQEITIELLNGIGEKAISIYSENSIDSKAIGIDKSKNNMMIKSTDEFNVNKYICKNNENIKDIYQQVENCVLNSFSNNIAKVFYCKTFDYDTDIILIVLQVSEDDCIVLEGEINSTTKHIEKLYNATKGFVMDDKELLEKSGFITWYKSTDINVCDSVEINLIKGTSMMEDTPVEDYNFNDKSWIEKSATEMADDFLQYYSSLFANN